MHTTELQDGYDWGRLNLQSVTEESSFHEFLRTAELAGTEFQAEKLNIQYVNPRANVGVLSNAEKLEAERKYTDKKDLLTIPRRPKWNHETTAAELQKMENESFLEWRRGLAVLQEEEGIVMTPYEKNLDFWRQLWRVVERSDVIFQIVDARNPLLFRSEDLEKYVKEVGENKLNMILINKADYLTESQRKVWCKYFDKRDVKVVFFSALLAQESQKLAQELAQEKAEKEEDDDEEDLDENDLIEESREMLANLTEVETIMEKIEEKLKVTEEEEKKTYDVSSFNSPKVLSVDELIEFFHTIYTGPTAAEGVTTIGLVGYPNVGKSSTINALLAEKKTSVSATPGKTKHFQTLLLDKDIMLCDCPGLVMPSFVLTKAEMILNGILPIDQMRDHVPPINQLCRYIPRHILEDRYGIMIAKPIEGEDPDRAPYSEEFLLAYGYNRGFMTANGQPDQARAARYVLKDFVNGKLLYAYAPDDQVQEEFHTFPDRVKVNNSNRVLPPREQRAIKAASSTKAANELDDEFFRANAGGAHIKGKSDFPHIRPTGNDAANGVHTSNPWKKTKREKKEKLRKKFAHLDQH